MRLSELKEYDKDLFDAAKNNIRKTSMMFDDDAKAAERRLDLCLKRDTELRECFIFAVTEEGHDFWKDINDKK